MSSQATSPRADVPQHVAIIMDGNGRWAKKRLMPRTYGHKKGVEATRRSIEFFARQGVSQLTLFAFSSENWKRPEEEVSSLMTLFVTSLQKNSKELHENGIRIRFVGDREAFSEELKQQIEQAESLTISNQRLCLNVAANYGGQWDIVQSVRQLISTAAQGKMNPSEITTEAIKQNLSLAGSPDPDLFIRTGGERRISNFLLWQLAYCELYFCDTLWPDFSEVDMQAALDDYASRQRRFGKTSEQIN